MPNIGDRSPVASSSPAGARASAAEGGRRAIVCGAGIAGLTTAWWLADAGWDVVVVEIAPGLREEGYLIDFLSSGYDVAERMGVLGALEAVAYPVSEIVDVDRSGRRRTSLDYDPFRRLQGGRLLSLMRGDLERVLFEVLPASVDVRYDLSIAAVDRTREAVEVSLTDGTRERADLLVGADGIHSRVRELVFGEESAFLRSLGLHTAAYTFEDESFRRALDGQFQNLALPNRVAGFYPIRNGRVATFFVYRTPDDSLPDSPCDALSGTFGDLEWLLPDALDHCGRGSDVYYDLVAQVEMARWTAGRVVLVGDACGGVSLLAGQGASLAMGGAYVLAEALREADSVDDGLAGYESRSQPAIEEKQAAGRRMANWMVPPSRVHLAVRNAVLGLAQFPGLSRLLGPALAAASESVVDETAVGER